MPRGTVASPRTFLDGGLAIAQKRVGMKQTPEKSGVFSRTPSRLFSCFRSSPLSLPSGKHALGQLDERRPMGQEVIEAPKTVEQ